MSGSSLTDLVSLIKDMSVGRLRVVMTSRVRLVLRVCVLYSRQEAMTKLPCRIGTLIVVCIVVRLLRSFLK